MSFDGPLAAGRETQLPLSAQGLSRIHQASLAVLEGTGVRFASEQALTLFRKRGFRVEGQRVFSTEKDILRALESVPGSFTILARNPRHNLRLEPGVASFGLGRGALIWVEPDGSHRRGRKEDLLAVTRLCQCLDVLEHWGPLIHPGDLDPLEAGVWSCRTMIEYTDKPYLYNGREDIDLVALSLGTSREQMAGRSDFTRSYGQATGIVTSPLSLAAEDCETLMEYARCGIAFHVASMPLAGTSGPCTLAGLVMQQNCENLAAIVLSQLVRPGCPVFYGAIGGCTDMRSLRPLFGTAEARLIERAGAQLARSYGLLCRGNAGLTDAPACDFQAGAEAMLHTLQVIRGGPEFLPGCGLLGSYLGASLAKIVLDAELIAVARRLLVPIRLDEQSLGVEALAEVGPGGCFLDHAHTLEHFRRRQAPDGVFQSTDYDRWAEQGRKEAVHLAQEKALRLIAAYEQPPLDAGLKAEIDRYVETLRR
jgi:trimethylamine--corrinoid protein Co-methyltransferase